MKALFVRSGNALLATDDESGELLRSIKSGELVEASITRPRNLLFHRKYFALLKTAFEAWEESRDPVIYKGREVQSSIERFRKDIAILCGHYEIIVNHKNETRLEAKSISFANMSEEDFSKLYSKTIDVLLSKILSSDWNEQALRDTVEKIVRF